MKINVDLRQKQKKIEDINFVLDLGSLEFKNDLEYNTKLFNWIQIKLRKEANNIIYPLYLNGTLTNEDTKDIYAYGELNFEGIEKDNYIFSKA
jgi:hypothetical protein